MSEGKGSGHEELYGGGGQRIELRGRRSEVRGQKTGILLWERLPCPEPVDGQPRSYDFNDSNEFNDLPLTGIGMQDEVSDSLFLFPDT